MRAEYYNYNYTLDVNVNDRFDSINYLLRKSNKLFCKRKMFPSVGIGLCNSLDQFKIAAQFPHYGITLLQPSSFYVFQACSRFDK